MFPSSKASRTASTIHKRPRKSSKTKEKFGVKSTNLLQQVPDPSTTSEVQTAMWPKNSTSDDASDKWGSKFCPVLLLRNVGHDAFEGRRTDINEEETSSVRERIGIGEINEELLSQLLDAGVAKWEDVYLQ